MQKIDLDMVVQLTSGDYVLYNDILYKDNGVGLVLTQESEDHYMNLVDSNNEYIIYFSEMYAEETLKELRMCRSDKDVVLYLDELGVVSYIFEKGKINIYDIEIIEEYICLDENEDIKKLSQEELEKRLIENDYANVIGNYIIVME